MLFRTIALITILISAQAGAQVVIHPRDIPNVPGMILTYYTNSDTANGIEVDVGQSGEDQHWDFSGYAFNEVTNDTIIDPEEAPDRETYPDANRVIISPSNELGLDIGGGGVQYEAVTDTGWFMFGVVGGIGGFELPVDFPTALQILPLPAEFEDSWEIGGRFEFGLPAPDTLLGGILDSIYIRIAIGGFSSIDGSGIVTYSGGDLPTLRQHISVGGNVTVVGTLMIFGRRVEQEVFRQEMLASQTYRWLSPSLGEIARITSLTGEADPDFNRAASIRVRRVIPELAFPNPPLAFGVVHVSNAGMALCRIRNSGEGVGSISRIEFSGGLEREIEVITALPMLIEQDSAATLRFLWSPSEEKSLWPNTASVYHNDPALHNPLVISLQGATPEFESVHREGAGTPKQFTLHPVSPNPFNSQTTIRYGLPEAGMVEISLVDMSGRSSRMIFTGNKPAGSRSMILAGSDLTAGLYFVRLKIGNRSLVTSAVYLK